MKLYYSPGACSLAPHIVLRETERHFDLERVDLKTHRTAGGVDFHVVNPKGYVPALEIGSEILTEVPAILQYLGDLVPEQRLVPASGTMARYELQALLGFIGTEIHKQLGPMFWPDTPERVLAKLRGKVAGRFDYVQNILVDRAYLMGETFCVADAYLFAMLQWCDRFHIDIQLWPNLDDYEFRISQRASVLAAMAAEGVSGRHRLLRSA